MEGAAGRDLAPPGALRPAQLGVILVGRVTLGHIGATVVDLAGRGHLCIEPVEGDDPDWRVTALGAEPVGLLDYERTLLGGFPGGPQALRLGLITAGMMRLLDKVRSQILRDAVSAGRLSHRLARRLLARAKLSGNDEGPVRRTRTGEELLKEIKAFRGELRAMAGGGDTSALARHAPYAMIFGLTAPVLAAGSTPWQSSDGAAPRALTTDFAACWHKAWETARPDGFRFWWDPCQPDSPGYSAAHGHGHGHGHHGGGFDSGHGGGFHGGHA
jgi:hypothetical protein